MPTLAEVARRLNRRADVHHLPPLILMTDETRLPDPRPALDRLPRGSLLILRHRDADARRVWADRLLPVCRRRGIRLSIAGDPGLAWRCGADGLHLSEAAAAHRPPRPRRRCWIITAAAHSPAALRRAARIGADAALLSPVFATRSHPDSDGVGPWRFAAWTRRAPLAVYALGGVNGLTARRLLGGGAVGIAGIGFAE